MAKARVLFSSAAMADLRKIAATYMKLAGADYARNITGKLRDTIRTLEDFPRAGAIFPEIDLAQREFRKLICENFVCVYKISGDNVVIHRIVDGRTNYRILLK